MRTFLEIQKKIKKNIGLKSEKTNPADVVFIKASANSTIKPIVK